MANQRVVLLPNCTYLFKGKPSGTGVKLKVPYTCEIICTRTYHRYIHKKFEDLHIGRREEGNLMRMDDKVYPKQNEKGSVVKDKEIKGDFQQIGIWMFPVRYVLEDSRRGVGWTTSGSKWKSSVTNSLKKTNVISTEESR